MCNHPGCTAEPTHDRSEWVNPEHLKIEYFCAAHAPPNAEPIDFEDFDEFDFDEFDFDDTDSAPSA